MNILEQTITLSDILHNHITWWIGGILAYLVGGLIFRNVMMRFEPPTSPMETDDKIMFGFFQFGFPLSMALVLIMMLIISLGLTWGHSLEIVAKRQAEKNKK